MVSLLRDTPLLGICPYILAKPCPQLLCDLYLFIAYLCTNYGDPDKLGFNQYLGVLGWQDQDPIMDRAIDGFVSNHPS